MDSMQSTSMSSLSGQADHFYPVVTPDDEVVNRPLQRNNLQGQGAFFRLITSLRVPVLGASRGSSQGVDHVSVGDGRSYGVSQAFTSPLENSTTISRLLNAENEIRTSLASRKVVAKRINVSSASGVTDEQQLAAITNEVRILSNKTLNKGNYFVKLVCVTWDSIPRQGRFWPRLVLEAADYGNLQEFLTLNTGTHTWNTKLSLALDVLTGLHMLHLHKIVHGDLKLENVLVFEERDDHPLGVKYRAKLCDFGFSVIMTDYESTKFSAKLGTPPWNAPELAFGTEINLEDLPSSDTYSFGLLFVRVFMNGGNPFQGLTLTEIEDLKQETDEGDTRLFNTLKEKMLAAVDYSEGQAAILQKAILVTTLFNPAHRFPLHLVGKELTLIGHLFGRDDDHQNDQNEQDHSSGSGSESESEHESPAPELIKYPSEKASSIPRSLFSMAILCLRKVASVFLKPVRYSLNAAKWGVVSVLRYVLRVTGVLKDPLEELLGPKEIDVDYIPRLPFARAKDLEQQLKYPQNESTEDIPDFEDTSRFSAHNLSFGTASELVRNLLSLAEDAAVEDKTRAGEVSYQLSIAYFEGIGTQKNIETSLIWLAKATVLESPKAITAISNIYASLDRQMPEDAAMTRARNLAKIAQKSLVEADTCLYGGLIHENSTFTIVKEWLHESPSQYKDYLESSEYRLTRTITFAFWLLSRGTSPLPGSDRTTSFRSILGYDASNLKIEPGGERDFCRYVRSQGCVNRPDDTLYLTLLQVAAIKGDMPLVKTLVGELGAKVDEIGVTPGMTALWLSCMFGNIDIAVYLADKGARVKCRDSITGRSILHFLNQARSTEYMGSLFRVALQSGLGIDDKDKEGKTPLLSTFVGWDFSLGAISKALVCLPDVNLLVKAESNWTLLSAAVARLDLDLIQAITERLPASQLRVSSNLNILSTTVEGELVDGYSVLLVHNEFHRHRVCGAAAKQVLQGIVDALVNERMQVTLRNSEVGKGTNPLIGACHTGYDDIVIAVLNTPACPDVNDVDETNGMSALHWAAEQGRYVSFVALLERGASPTLPRTADECNPFHHGAVFAPTMLLRVIENIESGKVSLANSLDMKHMMSTPNSDGFTIFDLAVIEGSADHLKLAENLRTRYCIAFDNLSIPTRHEAEADSRMTLLGYLVLSSVRSNVMEIESLEYMLSLSPQPRFIASTAGTTLLHLAVDGFFHDDMSSNPVGYIVLRLLLQRFPGKEFLYHADDQGLTPLHRAAYFGNAVAIDIIQSHVQGRSEQLDWNRLSSAGTTPLDHVGNVRGIIRVSEEDHRALHAILKKNTIRCFLKLRELGGQYSKELNNTIPVALMARTQDELSENRLFSWLQSMRRDHGLDWRFVEEPGVPHETVNSQASSFVVEICWAFDRFILQGSAILTENMSEYMGARLRHRFLSTNMNTTFPWHSTERVQEVQDNMQSLLGREIRWNRQGEAWTKDRVQALSNMVCSEWASLFEQPLNLAVVRGPTMEAEESEPIIAEHTDREGT